MTRTILTILALAFAALLYVVPVHASPAERALAALCPHAMALSPLVEASARRYLIHPTQLVATIAAESHCESRAENPRTGARGLGQILPTGSAAIGYEPDELWDAGTNLDATSRHLARLGVLVGGFGPVTRLYHGHKRSAGWRHDRHVRKVLALLRRCFNEETGT